MNLENNEVKFNHGVTPVASDRGDKLHRTLSQFVLRLEKDNRSSISSADRMSWTCSTCNVRAAYKFHRRVERRVLTPSLCGILTLRRYRESAYRQLFRRVSRRVECPRHQCVCDCRQTDRRASSSAAAAAASCTDQYAHSIIIVGSSRRRQLLA